jgi:hypothetical protein
LWNLPAAVTAQPRLDAVISGGHARDVRNAPPNRRDRCREVAGPCSCTQADHRHGSRRAATKSWAELPSASAEPKDLPDPLPARVSRRGRLKLTGRCLHRPEDRGSPDQSHGVLRRRWTVRYSEAVHVWQPKLRRSAGRPAADKRSDNTGAGGRVSPRYSLARALETRPFPRAVGKLRPAQRRK